MAPPSRPYRTNRVLSRRSRPARRNVRGGRNQYRENFTFSITPGFTSNVTVATLGNRPPRSNFRPISFSITATTAYVPPTTTLPGYYVPAALQILFMNPSGEYVSTSGQLALGTNPRRLSVRYPRSADWWPYNNIATDTVAVIDCVCLGTVPQNAVVRGTAQIRLAISQEIIVPTCPTLLTNAGISPSISNQYIDFSLPHQNVLLHQPAQAILPAPTESSASESEYEDSISDISFIQPESGTI